MENENLPNGPVHLHLRITPLRTFRLATRSHGLGNRPTIVPINYSKMNVGLVAGWLSSTMIVIPIVVTSSVICTP